MGFQIQTKRTPTADWSRFGPVWPNRNRALKEALRVKEIILRLSLKKLEEKHPELATSEAPQEETSVSKAVAIRVVDENGRQIWETPISD